MQIHSTHVKSPAWLFVPARGGDRWILGDGWLVSLAAPGCASSSVRDRVLNLKCHVYFVCISILPVCMLVYRLHAWCLRRQKVALDLQEICKPF